MTQEKGPKKLQQCTKRFCTLSFRLSLQIMRGLGSLSWTKWISPELTCPLVPSNLPMLSPPCSSAETEFWETLGSKFIDQLLFRLCKISTWLYYVRPVKPHVSSYKLWKMFLQKKKKTTKFSSHHLNFKVH